MVSKQIFGELLMKTEKLSFIETLEYNGTDSCGEYHYKGDF